jgi:hemoglobin
MDFKASTTGLLMLMVAFAGCGDSAEEIAIQPTAASSESTPKLEPSPDENVAGLERMCAEAQPAMAARQATATLFQRVGGRDGLQAVVADTVRRHAENDQIKHLLEGVDTEHLAAQVTDFLVVGTGGEGEYNGRDMTMAHAHLNLTNADFLAAGSDLGASMDGAGWGEDEKQELLCAFVALRGQVVTQ